jgi:hypothetical protein
MRGPALRRVTRIPQAAASPRRLGRRPPPLPPLPGVERARLQRPGPCPGAASARARGHGLSPRRRRVPVPPSRPAFRVAPSQAGRAPAACLASESDRVPVGAHRRPQQPRASGGGPPDGPGLCGRSRRRSQAPGGSGPGRRRIGAGSDAEPLSPAMVGVRLHDPAPGAAGGVESESLRSVSRSGCHPMDRCDGANTAVPAKHGGGPWTASTACHPAPSLLTRSMDRINSVPSPQPKALLLANPLTPAGRCHRGATATAPRRLVDAPKAARH